MENNNSETQANTTDRTFIEFANRGDDFYKIELLRQAKSWYKKALELNTENENVKAQIKECERQLAFENKVVILLMAIATVLILSYFVFVS